MTVTTNYLVTGNGITGSTANAVQALVSWDGNRARGLTVRNGALYLGGTYCRELGLNAFSLLTTQLDTPSSTEFRTIIDGAVGMGVRIIRFAMTPLSGAAIVSQMHGGTLKVPTVWADLSQTYRDALQMVFDYAASKGVFLIPTIVWTKSAVADAFSETPATAVVSATSKARSWMRAFVRLVVAQYKDHAALGCWQPINEPILVSGSYLTRTQAREIMTDMAWCVRQIDPSHAILSSNLSFIYDGLTTRNSLDAEVAATVLDNPDPTDTIDVHVYSDRAWISVDPANTLDSLTNAPFGYAYEWLTRMVEAGRAAGKPFVMSEFGVKGRIGGVGQETLGTTSVLAVILDAVQRSGCQLALIWNYRNSVVAGQDVWDISESTARGNAYIPLLTQYVASIRAQWPQERGASLFQANPAGFPKPIAAATFSGAGTSNAIYAGDAAFAGTTGTVLCWVRKNTTPTAFARVVGAQNSAGDDGWNLLYDGSGAELGLSLRKSAGGAGEARNTYGKLPSVPNNEWAMHGFTWNATDRIDCYLNGMWFDKVTTAYDYAGKVAGVGFRVGTSHVNANGATVSVANLCIVNRICTAREVADFYLYGTVPASGVLIPFDYDGRTQGAIEVNPTTLDASVTFGAA